MFRAYGGPYALAGVFKMLNDISAFVQPQLLRYLISFVDSYGAGKEPEPVIKGAAIALSMFGIAVFQTTMIHQYFQGAFITGMRIKAGLTSAIYRKTLKLSNEGRATKSTGDIVNYMVWTPLSLFVLLLFPLLPRSLLRPTLSGVHHLGQASAPATVPGACLASSPYFALYGWIAL